MGIGYQDTSGPGKFGRVWTKNVFGWIHGCIFAIVEHPKLMTNIRQGSIHLFRVAGVDVYLHWAWFLVAAFEISNRTGYSSLIWNVLEYLALFLIVMLHEYGHALACRQVGGTANQIVLWPLGGVAY